MKRTIFLSALVIALAGCGSKDDGASTSQAADPMRPTATQPGDQQASESPEAPAKAPIAVPDQGTDAAAKEGAKDTAPDLDALTRQLRGWMMANRTGLPKSFEAWQAAAGVKVPPPPPGKKYSISKTAWVVLVDK